MKILIIDNYDSFTYNLYHDIGEILENGKIDFELKVIRNDELDFAGIEALNFDKFIISPGPGSPEDQNYFGVCSEVILKIGKVKPLLGVCLGMQGIVHAFGGKIIRAKLPMHGKTSQIKHDSKGIFKNLPQNLEVMRYHSLIPDPKNIPKELIITSTVLDNSEEIMGIRHVKYPIEGVQFHPESFASEGGKIILDNFLDL